MQVEFEYNCRRVLDEVPSWIETISVSYEIENLKLMSCMRKGRG